MRAPRRGGDLASQDFPSILLVKPSSLGDVIHTLPVLHALRKRYPQSRIDWLIGSAFAPVLDGNSDVSERILFDRRKFSRLGWNLAATREFLKLIRNLRARRYDLVIDLQGLFRSGFLAWSTGAAVRIGFRRAREGAAHFYTHRVPDTPFTQHAVDRNMNVGQFLGFAVEPITFNLGLDVAVRRDAGTFLSKLGLGKDTRFIAILPGARWETKIWPVQKFTQAIALLAGLEPDVRCVLLGGPEDQTLCDRIVDGRSDKAASSLAGKTSIRQMMAILERAAVVLCHDSAPMHAAVALGRPLVCLMGPTNPARTGPYRRMEDVLQLSLPCSPCYLRKLAKCDHEHRCMRDLTVDAVVARIRSLLSASRVPAGGVAEYSPTSL